MDHFTACMRHQSFTSGGNILCALGLLRSIDEIRRHPQHRSIKRFLVYTRGHENRRFQDAGQDGNLHIIKYLETKHNIPPINYFGALNAACLENFQVVPYLAMRCNPHYTFSNSLVAYARQSKSIRFLIEKCNADIHERNDDILYIAFTRKLPIRLIKYLIHRGADINNAIKNNNCSHDMEYIIMDSPKHLRLLCKIYSDDMMHRRIMINMCETGNLKGVQFISKKPGVDLNKALVTASGKNHLPIVRYLIRHGADIHHNDDEALRIASENGHLEIVKYLLKKGANITPCNSIKAYRQFCTFMYLYEYQHQK